MPSQKYITIRVLRDDLARIRRALNSHEFLGGTSAIRWFNWLSYMTGSEILAAAKTGRPPEDGRGSGADRRWTHDASYLLSDEDEAEAKRLDVEDQE